MCKSSNRVFLKQNLYCLLTKVSAPCSRLTWVSLTVGSCHSEVLAKCWYCGQDDGRVGQELALSWWRYDVRELLQNASVGRRGRGVGK